MNPDALSEFIAGFIEDSAMHQRSITVDQHNRIDFLDIQTFYKIRYIYICV